MQPWRVHIGSIPDLLRSDRNIGRALKSFARRCNPDRRSEKPRPVSAWSYSLVPKGGRLATSFSPNGLRIIPDVWPMNRANAQFSHETQRAISRFHNTPQAISGFARVNHFDTRVQFCNTQKRTDELKSHLCWNSNSSVNGLKDCRFRDVLASFLAGDCRHNSFFCNTLSQLPAICLFSLPAPDHKAPLLCLRPRLPSAKGRCVN